MSKKDELAIAEFAAIVGSSLKHVDAHMIDNGTGGQANRLDPRKFISPQNLPGNQRVRTEQRTQVAYDRLTLPGSEQKINPMPPQIVGTEAVDVNSLLIPMPEDLAKRVSPEELNPIPNTTPTPRPTVGVAATAPVESAQSGVVVLLTDIKNELVKMNANLSTLLNIKAEKNKKKYQQKKAKLAQSTQSLQPTQVTWPETTNG